jgi:2-C-methyl-D-erythritol 2,4-cyclodiphosphate synthase
MRIGHGYDVHRFGEGDFVTLGGVQISHRFGLLAHSDGDVLLHALSDALLGAAALGDIGKHFPDTDPAFKGADSRVLLRHVLKQVQSKGWKVGNIDATIVAQAA